MTNTEQTPIKIGNSADWFNDNVQHHIDRIPEPYKSTYDAAPELLEALEAVLLHNLDETTKFRLKHGRNPEVVQRAVDALSKARGQL